MDLKDQGAYQERNIEFKVKSILIGDVNTYSYCYRT